MASSKTNGARSALAAAVAVSLVAARVLVDHEPLGLKVGHIVEGTQAQIDSLVAGGIVDAHPDAVAYAAGLGGEVVQLVAVAVAEQAPAPDAGDAAVAAADAATAAPDAPAADATAQDPAA